MDYRANGQSWDVRLSDHQPHEGVRAIVFHCTSNSSRGWRVVEVPASEYDEDDVASLSESQLDELWDRSQPFDFTHDPKALEDNIGDTPMR